MHTLPRSSLIPSLMTLALASVVAPVGFAQDCSRWEQRENPPGRVSRHSMVFDSRRGVIVLFGGQVNRGAAGRTYEWNGTNWLLRSTTGPGAQIESAGAYDSRRGVTVLLGRDTYGYSSETWEWNGDTWIRRFSSDRPPVLSGHRMAFDSVRGVTVMFGGIRGGPVMQDETWEWDGEAWTHRNVVGPSPRTNFAMSYDPRRREVVLFGGLDAQRVALADTWTWDGGQWRQRDVEGPSARLYASMSYDTQRRRIVLFGGSACSTVCTGLSDLWSWDGTRWSKISDDGPPPRTVHAAAFDSWRGQLVVYGGELRASTSFPPGTIPGDTWGWDGRDWAILQPEPLVRTNARIAFDSAQRRLVLVGGVDDQGQTPLPDTTLEWNGSSWAAIPGGELAGRYGHALATDTGRNVVVLFGGFTRKGVTNETWEWNGTSWSRRSTEGPSPRPYASMGYDPRRGVTVLFGGGGGGVQYGDTWEWDGVAWLQRATSGPAPRTQAGMAFDPSSGVMLLHGGKVAESFAPSMDDLWAWDGNAWTRVEEGSGIVARAGHTLVHDPVRAVNLVFGGESRTPGDAFYAPNDLWEWNGVEWRQSWPFGEPERVWEFAYDKGTGCFDPLHDSVLMHARDSSSEYIPCAAGDPDGDGVPDPYDQCLDSNLDEVVSIGDCESDVSNHLFADGCTMMDRIAECETDARNHGAFVACVGDLVDQWRDDNAIEPNQKGDIIHCAAQAEIPTRPTTKVSRIKSNRVQPDRAAVDDPVTEPLKNLSRP